MCYELQADSLGIQEALMPHPNEDAPELAVDNELKHTRKTHMLERVFNRALTQALFQGKRGINQIDLILSILAENQSVAVNFADQLDLIEIRLCNGYNKVQLHNNSLALNRLLKNNKSSLLMKSYVSLQLI